MTVMVIMKIVKVKNCHVRKQVNEEETDSHEEVQEVDSRL